VTQVNFNSDWLTALEARLGTVSEIRKIGAEGKPVIHVLYFAHKPKRGLMTAVTCGLSKWPQGPAQVGPAIWSRPPPQPSSKK
jgi:hypothetical protein